MSSSIVAFRRVLHSGRLRRLLASFFFYTLSEWGTWVAMLVWAYDVMGPGFVGIVGAIQLVFAAVATPVFSVVGDRIPRARALSLTYGALGSALVVTGVALVADAPIIVSIALASIATTLISVARPIHASLIPDLASEPSDAVAANVVSSTFEGAGTFLGPALAGLVLFVAGPGMVFIALGGGVLCGAFFVGGMGQVERAGSLGEPSDGGVLAAYRTLAETPNQRFLVVLGGTSQLVVGALDVLIVVLALEVLGLGDSGASFLYSLMGLGGLAGAVVAASMVGRRFGPVVIAGGLVRGGALLVLGVEPAWIFLFVVSGAGFSLIEVGVRTMLQRLAAPDVMSRVFGVLESVALIGLAGGSLLAAGMIAAFGVEMALMFFGAMVPMVLIVGYRLLVAADLDAHVPRDVIAALDQTELFSLLAPPTLEMVARRSRIVQFGVGVRIIEEGERSTFVLLIVEGSLRVSKDERHLADLGAGDVVGEIAALHGVPRTATVTATEPVKAISIPADAFVMAVRGEAEAWSLSSSVAGRRLSQQQT